VLGAAPEVAETVIERYRAATATARPDRAAGRPPAAGAAWG